MCTCICCYYICVCVELYGRCTLVYLIFFFKQKTAYEMRISDWSSDVCSSDLSLLVALGCSREEVLLHERDAQGLCAYVGTYCSDKFLGVCLTKKKVYCCFESKLSRILQEQGRRQLPKPWDKPKEEQCEGFTLDEFARLDLSQMDFSEVYAEFTEAARLPDELETSILIQQKIEDYYARSGQ